MRRFKPVLLIALLALLSACEEEAAPVENTEVGGEAAGEILGGTISDDMLPLEELTSTSPPAARRPATTTTTTVSEGENGETTVETSVTTTNSDAPTPAPPVPPAVQE